MKRLLLWVGLALFIGSAHAGCGGQFNCVQGEAECINGACVCQSPFSKGNGNFACYRDREVAAEIKNDPHLISFNNESSPFPFPCRYLVTHIRQILVDAAGSTIGQCEFEIYAFNAKAKHRGKFFLHGFDVAGRLTYNSGGEVTFSSRNYGTAHDGDYTFTERGTWGQYLSHGPWGEDKIKWEDSNEVRVKVKTDRNNNRLKFEAWKCGLVIHFVPYDVDNPYGQTSLPGISVSINKERNLEFLDHGLVMGLAPLEDGGQSYSELTIGSGGLNQEESLLNRAFRNSYEQVQHYSDNDECIETGDALATCERHSLGLYYAYNNCYWILKEPRFIKCYDDTNGAQKILNLFKKCVKIYCDTTSCFDVIADITESGCYPKIGNINSLTRFMRGEFCPF